LLPLSVADVSVLLHAPRARIEPAAISVRHFTINHSR
jgi:hypothetical protein